VHHAPGSLLPVGDGPARTTGRRLLSPLTALAVLATIALQAPVSPATAAPVTATPAAVPAENHQRPDEASARQAANSTRHDVLITDATTETSLTYAQPDGSLRSEVSPVPVRVAQAGGAWADVDYDLVRVKDGWAPKVSPVDVVFSAGGNGPAVSLDEGAHSVDLSWAKDLPAPTIDGNNALYQLTADEVLVLTATSDGFEQSLKLLAPPATAPRQRLGFDLTGVTMVADKAGGYDFVKTSAGKATSTVIFTMPKPKMYSSLVVGEEHTQTQTIPVTLGRDADGGAYLDLAAGMPFLSDPKTVYPVWIDPAVSSVSRYGDTYVTEADADSHVSDSDIRIGLSSNGNKRRALIRFNTTSSVPAGSHVTSAALKLYNNTSSTCTARTVQAYPVTEAHTLTTDTWANQPSYSTSASYSASASFSYGNEDLGCANGTGSITVTNMVQAWVKGTLTDYGMLVKAGSETDTTYAKFFCSMNVDATATTACTTSSRYPTLSVVYNSYPGTPTGGVFSPKIAGTITDAWTGVARLYSTSLTPTFTAKVANADGAKVALQVKMSYDVNYPSEGAGEIGTVTSAAVTPGSKASVTVPAGMLTGGTHIMYQLRARVTNGAGGYDYSAWSPASLSSSTTSKISLNIAAPAAPVVTCGSYPAGQWTAPAATTTSCTFDTSSTDGAGYYWGLDDPATPNLANDSSNGGAAVAVSGIRSVSGWHTLYVRSRDTALHLSSTTTAYTFGVGAGGVLGPVANASTARAVALSSSAGPAYTGVTYQWAPGSSSTTWTDLPVAHVTPAGSSTPIAAWPLTGTASGSLASFSGYNWNVAATLAAAGEPDGALRIRAKFTTAAGVAGYSAERTFILAVTTFGQSAATAELGPGTVSLTTGDFQVAASDAAVGKLGVGRVANSLAPAAATTGPAGIFGAGWLSSLPSGEYGDATLIDNSASGSVTITMADGTEHVYTRQTTGTYAGRYLGIGDAGDGGVLARSTTITNPADAGDTTAYTGWQLTEADGTVTTWLRSSTGVWAVAWVDATGKESETTYARDANGRVAVILAPTPAGVSCTTASYAKAGCDALQLTYATATGATGTAEASWGTYAGLVSSISWTGYDPSSSAMVTKQVAAYQYDSTGHLRATWDPRLATPLKTRYTYDAAGRIATITPPGQNGWTLAYDTAGRMAGVSRTDPANGTATQAVAYDLAVSGVAGAPDVSGAIAAGWGQISDLAFSGAAVFPASHVPPRDGTTGAYTPGSGDWPYAGITYADVNGREVDTAKYGAGAWQITSTRYDDDGREVWSLNAGNRAQALTPGATTDPYVASQSSSAARADLLATVSTYTADGADLAATLGPAHPAELSSGETASIRSRTTYTYDAGAPTTDAYHLVTKVVVTPLALDGSTVPAADARTTVTGYDPIDGSSATGTTSGWTLHAATTETTWMGTSASSTADLTTRTRYDTAGRVVETRLPDGAATAANTTVTTYYTTAANTAWPACGGKPHWAGLVCRTDPGGAASAGHAVPSKVYTYDRYGQAATVTETSGAVTRTTTTSYDEIGRTSATSVTVTGLTGSTAVPAITYGFDAATGLQVTTTAGPAVLTSTFDALGRELTYTDADGNTTTRTFDLDGNVATVNDGKGSYGYTYGSATEHRELVTALNTGMGGAASTFTGAYDAAGNLVAQTYPNGTTAQYTYDNTGAARNLTYTLPTYSGGTANTLAFSTVADAHGQTAHTQSGLSAQDFTYDQAGRLVTVRDTTDGSCTVRVYGYDKQSDRTSLTGYGATADGDCQTTTASSTRTSTYDTANRVLDSGYTYDQLGRTLTVPAAALTTGGAAMTLGYHDNDLTAALTQGTTAKSFTVDPGNRYRQVTTKVSGAETERVVNHYAAASDSPAWIATSMDAGGSWTWARNVTDLSGTLGAVQNADGTATLQLSNLHGDIVATVPNRVPTSADPSGASTTAQFESTEYGVSRDGSPAPRYGWLGAQHRSGDAAGSLMLMGARLYNPATGAFLSTDPVDGGNANDYTYPANPNDNFDLDGNSTNDCQKKWWKICGVVHNHSGHDLRVANKPNGKGHRCTLPTGHNSDKWPCYMADADSYMNPDGWICRYGWWYRPGTWLNFHGRHVYAW
jgi:RHS repeat-associated protein